jgi:hypothetical protein
MGGRQLSDHFVFWVGWHRLIALAMFVLAYLAVVRRGVIKGAWTH